MEKYKLAFIYGNNDKSRGIKEGQVEKFGVLEEGSLHIRCLLDFANDKYSDIPVFRQLNERHTPETVGYFITLLDHIVFFNTTSDIKKYGKTGMFLMPNNISDTQKDALYNFADTIDDFSVVIAYDLNMDAGILDAKELYSTEKNSVSEMLNSYFSRKDVNNKTK